jgi:hypothetical protein
MPSAFGEHFGIAALCQRERRVNRFHVIHFHRAFLVILLEPLRKDKVLNPYSIDAVVVFLNWIADFQCEKANSTPVPEMKWPGCVKVHVGICDHLQQFVRQSGRIFARVLYVVCGENVTYWLIAFNVISKVTAGRVIADNYFHVEVRCVEYEIRAPTPGRLKVSGDLFLEGNEMSLNVCVRNTTRAIHD